MLQHWKNWHPDAGKNDPSVYKLTNGLQGSKLTIPGGYFLIRQTDSYHLLVKKMRNNDERTFVYSIVPNATGLTTTIIVTFKTSLLKYLVPVLREHDLNETGINDFKRFMEDPRLYYGFNILRSFEKEKKIIVKKETIASKQLYSEVIAGKKQLLNYISLKHLTPAGSFMVQYNTKAGDSLQVLMGVPVNKQIPIDKDFLYMYMPSTKTVTGDFKGKYQDRKKIYAAVANYVQDKFLSVKIAPYEKFADKFPVNDLDVVDFQLTYPVF